MLEGSENFVGNKYLRDLKVLSYFFQLSTRLSWMRKLRLENARLFLCYPKVPPVSVGSGAKEMRGHETRVLTQQQQKFPLKQIRDGESRTLSGGG